jgi:3-phenylpropionate/cinnamic acid dioxygenase small subunit
MQDLIDRARLKDAVMTFAVAVDTLDMALYRQVFAEECEYDLSGFNGQPPVTARAADWAASMEGFLRGFDATQHLLSNLAFDIAGDEATVTADVRAEHFRPNGEGDASVTLGGAYTFRLRRERDGWKIAGFALRTRWHRGNQALYALAGSGSPRR